MPNLTDFMQAHAARAWAWGVVDCSLVLADWLVSNGYPDVAADLRGTYRTEDECRALVMQAGGLLPLVTLCVQRIDLPIVSEPEVGAIAVIGAAVRRDRQWGAIWDGAKWQVRWTEGFVGFAARPLAIWSV